MGEWLETEMKRLNISDIKKHMPGEQILEGQKLQLPPILLGRYGKDPKKKTVLVYGHYDVQPALLSDGWETDPWTLVEKDGKLYGRGSTDDKAPVISWLHVIEAYQKLSMDFPVNLVMCFEGMEGIITSEKTPAKILQKNPEVKDSMSLLSRKLKITLNQ